MNRSRFRFSTRSGDDIQQEIRDEFAFHLQARIDDLQRLGIDPAAARRQAEAEFGDQRAGLAGCRRADVRHERARMVIRLADDLRRDVGYGVRGIRRSPGLSAVIVLTIAVAIAGNTAVFSIVNWLLLTAPLIDRPERIVRIRFGENRMSWPNFDDLRDGVEAFDAVAAQEAMATVIRSGSPPLRVTGARVTSNYFAILGVQAALGRAFAPSDERTDLVVLSDRLWRSRFGADPGVIGRIIEIGRGRAEIIGVMPRGFAGIAPPGLGRELWTPFEVRGAAAAADRLSPKVEAIGRLRAGATVSQALAATRVLADRLHREHPALGERVRDVRMSGITGVDAFQGLGSVAVPIFGFVGLLALLALTVLFVSCANVAGLLIGRSAARSREIAIRLALGSGRRRLIGQLLIESLLLAVLAGGVGLLLSVWILGGLSHAVRALPFPVDATLSIDRRTIAFTALVACLTSLIFGLAPARHAAHTDLVSGLKSEPPASNRRFRRALVTAQVFGCSVLLVWASLFARSLANVTEVDPGFHMDGVYVVDLDALDQGRPDPNRQRDVSILEEARQLAAVESVGAAWAVPLAFMSNERHSVRLADVDSAPQRRVDANTISPGYLQTVRIPLRAGRDIAWSDDARATPVVLVNETAARQFWNGHAVGRRLRVTERTGDVDLEVVGVVGDSKYWTLGEEIAPTIYRPMLQRSMSMQLFIRTTDPAQTLPGVRGMLERLAPGMPVDIQRFSDAAAASMMPARVGSIATAGFGMASLLLAILGLYGLISFSVAQRAREMGIRRALGASTIDIVRHIVGGSMTGVLKGLVPGLLVGCAGAFLLSAYLVRVHPFDFPTMGVVVAIMVGATAAASLGPALRAARVDPLRVLRDL